MKTSAPRRLNINADDLGLDPAIDDGVFECAARGAIQSASMLAGGPSAKIAARRARDLGLPVGLHLALSDRLPSSSLNHKIAPNDGMMRQDWKSALGALLCGHFSLEDVRREWLAQLQTMLSFGIQPTHIDSHQHVHAFPGLFGIAKSMADALSIPLRIPAERHPQPWHSLRTGLVAGLGMAAQVSLKLHGNPISTRLAIGIEASGRADLYEWRLALSKAPDAQCLEFVCHPGRLPASGALGWDYPWQQELELLLSTEWSELLQSMGYRRV